ncbi:MAG: FUSC family protein [Acidobacteriaceae bacterium]
MGIGPIAGYLNDSYVFNWRKQTFAGDLVFVVPIAFCLGLGLAVGHPAAGMIAGGGAMTVGFGAKQSIDRSRLLPMIFASVGMAFSVFVGMVAGHRSFMLVVVAAFWAFGYGMLTSRPGGYGWVGQQCVVMLLVGSAFPFSARMALVRALLVLAGGAVQVLWSSAALRLFRQLGQNLVDISRYLREEELALRAAMIQVAATVRQRRFRGSTVPYALRLAVTVGVSTEIDRRLHFASGYWIPMTAVLVLKPGLADTVSRAVARTLGTILGAWALSVVIIHFAPSLVVVAAITVLFAWLSYATLNVNYALFAACLTGYIVFLLSLAQIPGVEIAHRRAFCTAVGGALALAVRLVVLRRRKARQRKAGVQSSALSDQEGQGSA